ncbi:MAG: MgtC/SapB family protein [Vampirovibrio sp.]|nr:MgtC/SapB family protein [Vampirovibrio sp.]
MELNITDAIIRILLAVILGSIVGLEREINQHSAGLRTHILVCLGSSVFTVLSISSLMTGVDLTSAVNGMANGVDYRIVRDPGRIAAQILPGIGFIGGGAVLRYGASVKGLTTAASLWIVASIGMLVGTGYYLLSVITTVIAFLVLFAIGQLEHTVFKKHLKPYDRARVLMTVLPGHIESIQKWMEEKYPKEVLEMQNTGGVESSTANLKYVLDIYNEPFDVNNMGKQLKSLPGVLSSSIKIYQEADV